MKRTKVDFKQLDELISKVSMAVSTSSETPTVAQVVRLKDGHMIAYNDEVIAYAPLPFEGVEGCVGATDFFKLTKYVPDKPCTVWQEGDKLRVKRGGGFGLSIDIHGYEPLPADLDQEVLDGGIEWSKLPEHFMKGLSLVSLSCVKLEQVSFYLPVLVDEKEVCASDTYCASRFTLGRKPPEVLKKTGRVQLAPHSIRKLTRLELTEVGYKQGLPWLFFKEAATGLVVGCRILEEGRFEALVDFHTLFETDEDAKELSLPKELLPVLERAGVFVKADQTGELSKFDHAMTLQVEGREIKVIVERLYGRYEETVKIGPTKGMQEGVEFQINPLFLHQFYLSGFFGTCTLDNTKVKFTGKEEGWKWEHIIALPTSPHPVAGE